MSTNRYLNCGRWKRLFERAFTFGPIALLLFALGLVCIVAGLYWMATPADISGVSDSAAMVSLDDCQRSLLSDITRVVRPAIARNAETCRRSAGCRRDPQRRPKQPNRGLQRRDRQLDGNRLPGAV